MSESMDATVAMSHVVDLAGIFGSEELGHDVGSHMTCGEAEAFAAVLRLVSADGATAFLRGHATEDDEGDMHHVCRNCGELCRIVDGDQAGEWWLETWTEEGDGSKTCPNGDLHVRREGDD